MRCVLHPMVRRGSHEGLLKERECLLPYFRAVLCLLESWVRLALIDCLLCRLGYSWHFYSLILVCEHYSLRDVKSYRENE